MSDELRIVLVGAAKAAHDKMLAEVLGDGRTSISSSKMMNWIVTDYFERSFANRKKQLCQEHLSERKWFEVAMKIEDPEERRRALQEIAKSLGAAIKAPRRRKKRNALESDAQESK